MHTSTHLLRTMYIGFLGKILELTTVENQITGKNILAERMPETFIANWLWTYLVNKSVFC